MSHTASVLAPLSSEPPVTGEAKVDINTAQGRGLRTAAGGFSVSHQHNKQRNAELTPM